MTLDIITDDRLGPLRHGFFGRAGGASSGIYRGLNCGMGSDDQRDVVTLNRSRVAEAVGVTPTHLCGVHQIHSADVITITTPQTDKPKADALVTSTPGLALSILTADCQPVLFADKIAGVIGAAHAGWKGAQTGVLENTIQAMEDLGAKRGRIVAAIGPSISQPNYEVGPEFFETFCDGSPENGRFFIKGVGDRHLFDLPAYGIATIKSAGVADVRWTGHCSYADPERFYSYRRTTHAKEPDYGRMIAVIRL